MEECVALDSVVWWLSARVLDLRVWKNVLLFLVLLLRC